MENTGGEGVARPPEGLEGLTGHNRPSTILYTIDCCVNTIERLWGNL